MPVELDALPEERLAGPVEAAAFFTVSEALTNVARYAQATVAHVDVRTADGHLAIEVADDGVGGADARTGIGPARARRPARRRSAASCGWSSPPGQGTRLSATIPLDQPEPDDAPPRPATAREPGALRRRILQSHAVVYALVMALLVFIWLTTGAGYFWPQWSIAGWGLLLALHAWFARGRPPGMLARQTHPDR